MAFCTASRSIHTRCTFVRQNSNFFSKTLKAWFNWKSCFACSTVLSATVCPGCTNFSLSGPWEHDSQQKDVSGCSLAKIQTSHFKFLFPAVAQIYARIHFPLCGMTKNCSVLKWQDGALQKWEGKKLRKCSFEYGSLKSLSLTDIVMPMP